MSVSEGKFGRKKEEAIVALLSQRSVDEAARSANVNPRTLYRWMKEPEFDVEYRYRAAKRAAYGQLIARLHQASSAAVTTLLKLMVDQNVPTRARCADSVLAHTAKAIELEHIEARL